MLMRGLGAANDQIAMSTYTGPVGGFACNTAGGYSLVMPSCYSAAVCMTPSQLAQANAQCSAAPAQTAVYVSNDPAGPPPVQQPTPAPTPTPIPNTTPLPPSPTLVNANGDIVIGTFDATQFVETYWMWLAGGVAAILLLKG